MELIYELERKAKSVKWNMENRKLSYIIFSKSGFETSLMEYAKKNENVRLYEG